jgi:hypothetical protein
MTKAKFVEHLRDVHFTIIVTSGVLLIAGFLPRPAMYEKARRQLASVDRMAQLSRNDGGAFFLDNAAARYFADHPGAGLFANDRVVLRVRQKGKAPTDYTFIVEAPLAEGERTTRMAEGLWTPYTFDGPDNILGAQFASVPTQLATLDSFMNLWDVCGKTQYMYVADADGLIGAYSVFSGAMISEPVIRKTYSFDAIMMPGAESARSAESVPDTESRPAPGPSSRRVNGPPQIGGAYMLRACDLDDRRLLGNQLNCDHVLDISLYASDLAWAQVLFQLNVLTNASHVLIPVRSLRIPVDLRAQMIAADSGSVDTREWKAVSFEQLFPELASATRGLTSMTFEQLTSFIAHQADEARGTIDVFGAKIPYDALATWGSLILAVIIMYFVLHLRYGLRAKIDFTAAPWIGGYGDAWSVVATVASLSVLPIATVARLCVASVALADSFWGRVEAIGIGVPAVILSIVAAWTFRRMLAELRRRGSMTGASSH